MNSPHLEKLISPATRKEFPRDIETAVLMSLPVCIVKVGRLSINVVHDELRRRNISIECPVSNRDLRGCLVAQADHGLIFVDGEDPSDERRFTVAHEAAHFLVDYLEPRARALVHFGESIRAVLDNQREPTSEEKVSAFLARVPLHAHVHIMSRDGDGGHFHCECRADDLAYEMLAPFNELQRAIPLDRTKPGMRASTMAVLRDTFGLPEAAAADYARRLYPREPLIPLRALLGL
jgi:hypothetical protein